MTHPFPLRGPCNKLLSAPDFNVSICLASLCIGHKNWGWTTGPLGLLGSLSSYQQWEVSERQGEETEDACIIFAFGKITLAAELTPLKVTSALQIQYAGSVFSYWKKKLAPCSRIWVCIAASCFTYGEALGQPAFQSLSFLVYKMGIIIPPLHCFEG